MATLRTSLTACGLAVVLIIGGRLRADEPASAPATPPLTQSAEDPDFHFKIQFPDSWILGKTPKGTIKLLVPAPSGKGGSLMITGYPITALPPGDLTTLDQVLEREMRIAKAGGSKIVELGDTTLGKLPAKRLAFSTEFKGQTRVVQSVFALKDGVVYGFSFQASQETYDRSADTLRAVADTFTLPK